MTKTKRQHACFGRFEDNKCKDLEYFHITQISVGLKLAPYLLAELHSNPILAELQFRTIVGCDPDLEDEVPCTTIWNLPDMISPRVSVGTQALADYLGRPDLVNVNLTPTFDIDESFMASIVGGTSTSSPKPSPSCVPSR